MHVDVACSRGNCGGLCERRGMDMCIWRWIDPEIQIQGLLNEEETLETDGMWKLEA
jgi:hypothetical protein